MRKTRYIFILLALASIGLLASCGKLKKARDFLEGIKGEINGQKHPYKKLYQGSVENDVNNRKLHERLRREYSTNEMKEYREYISNFLKKHPDSYAGFFQLGYVLQTYFDDYDAAIEAYQKAIKLKPDYASAYFNIADIYRERKDWESAIKYVELASKYGDYWDEKYLYLYLSYVDRGELEKALALARERINSPLLAYCDSRKTEYIPRLERNGDSKSISCLYFNRMINYEIQTLFEMGNKTEATEKCKEDLTLKDIWFEETTIKYCNLLIPKFNPGALGANPVSHASN